MLIAGNWKMNTSLSEAVELAKGVVEAVGDPGAVDVAVCPPFISLDAVYGVLRGSPVRLGAQTLHYEDAGAYTGEVSAGMLQSVGCHYVIIGHSERRQYFGETDETVNRKVRRALAGDLVPIVCIGETLAEREAGREQEVVRRQLNGGLADVSVDGEATLVLAYEPVWAIGTGRTASPEQAQEMHAFIRGWLAERYSAEAARNVAILYGGSMKPANADDLLAQPDVDGGLIGGASLKAHSFATLVAAARVHAGG